MGSLPCGARDQAGRKEKQIAHRTEFPLHRRFRRPEAVSVANKALFPVWLDRLQLEHRTRRMHAFLADKDPLRCRRAVDPQIEIEIPHVAAELEVAPVDAPA